MRTRCFLSKRPEATLLYPYEGHNYIIYLLILYVVFYQMPSPSLYKLHQSAIPVPNTVIMSRICNNCNVVERPLMKPNCLLLKNLFAVKCSIILSRKIDSISLHTTLVRLTGL